MPTSEGELLAGGPPHNEEHRPGLDVPKHPCQDNAPVPQQVPDVPGDTPKAGGTLPLTGGPVLGYRDREVILLFRESSSGESARAAHRGEELDHCDHGGPQPVEE